jgi:hypothetical protein
MIGPLIIGGMILYAMYDRSKTPTSPVSGLAAGSVGSNAGSGSSAANSSLLGQQHPILGSDVYAWIPQTNPAYQQQPNERTSFSLAAPYAKPLPKTITATSDPKTLLYKSPLGMLTLRSNQ